MQSSFIPTEPGSNEHVSCTSSSQTKMSPGAPLTNFNDGGVGGGGGGGPTEVHILCPKKSQLQNFSIQKKSLHFLAYPKKSLSPFFATQKNPFVSFGDPKNPSVFYRPQKIALGQSFRPNKITRTPPSLKYVSGAPGRIRVVHLVV